MFAFWIVMGVIGLAAFAHLIATCWPFLARFL